MNRPTIRTAIPGLIVLVAAVIPFAGQAEASGYGAHHQTVLHMRTLHALTALAHSGSVRTLPMTFTSRRPIPGHGSSGEGSGGFASRFATRANVTDPTTLFVDPADWNNTEFWTFMAASDLDNAQFNPMREFHKTGYTGSGLIGNGECGQDANGDPYSFVCSGFLQEEIVAIQPNHTIDANYLGSVYTSSSKATARYQDALKANGAKNGVSCGLASQGVPNCESWLYRFTNTNNIVVAWGIYTGFQYGNAFGETVAFISPSDYNNGNGSKFQTFVSDSSNLDIDALGAFLFMTNNARVALSNPLQVATPFSLWPVAGVASAVALKPSDADNSKTNPLRAFHSKSYISSGMLGNGS
ncbi:MAG TPA: hypothetical protein VG815_04260, partial [Chloroflexota bacterium]|nr:hypothetical protein [Chloroflexota bacterium]